MHRARYLIVLAGLFVVAGCGGLAPGETLAPSVPPICFSFGAVQARIADIQALDPETATYDEVRMALIDLQAAWRQMSAAAGDVTEDGYAELNYAMRELERAASQLPQNVAPRDALALLEEEFQAVVASATALSDELGCVDQLSQ